MPSTWKFNNKTVDTLPEDCEAFVYLITNKTNDKKYVGKKLAKLFLDPKVTEEIKPLSVMQTEESYQTYINIITIQFNVFIF